MTIQYLKNIHEVDTAKVLLTINVSLQAYAAFDRHQPAVCQKEKITVPEGYEFLDSWTGVDAIFGKDRTVECYGVVFRSLEAPYTYLFGFRGTADFLDALDDIGVESQPFSPFDSLAQVPSGVRVESGFSDVYRDSTQGTPSMQNQLFALIDTYSHSDKPISQLLITGHSLGAALSTLFTLDLALSRPEVAATNINFASPRTGNADFVQFYESQPAQQSTATRTLRVQNTHDKVPCVPPEDLGYAHLTSAFLVAFAKDSFVGDLDLAACHSSLNYQAVLQCASTQADGICIEKKLPVPQNGYAITSKEPQVSEICSLW